METTLEQEIYNLRLEFEYKLQELENRLKSQSQDIRILDDNLMSLGEFVNSRVDTLQILMEHLGISIEYDTTGPKRLTGKFILKANTTLNKTECDLVTLFNVPFNSEVE